VCSPPSALCSTCSLLHFSRTGNAAPQTVETVKTTETQKVTTLVPIESITANKEKRGNDQVPAGMIKAFDALVRDNRDFVVAQCKAAKFAPITMTSTVTATQYV
jgi:hypothetical protein